MKKKSAVFSLILFLALSLLPPGFSFSAEEEKKIIIESMEFREVDIKDILRQLAKQYDLNIVFSEAVKGLVTVQLNNVSIEQSLDSVITVNGFAYTKKENVYKVTTQDEALREGKQTKLFRLNNADAVSLKATLSKVLSPDGSIEADSRANAIVVTDSLAVINKIEGMIPALDELTPQVLIEAKLIETSLTRTETLGIDWTTTIRASGAKRPITFPFGAKGKQTILSKNQLPQPTANTTDFLSSFAFPYAVKGDFTLGTLDFSSLAMVLDFLKSRTDTKLVASPSILTLNNQKAMISVGKVVPIALYQRNESTGAWEITGWEEQNIGINLEVTPQISPDGHIKLKLKPEVSNIVDYIGEDVNTRPITSSRTAETEVLIRDGETIVIAGLVKTKDATTINKIPILGDIPFIGRLFKREEKGSSSEPDEKTDLLIFVTANIIKDKPVIRAAEKTPEPESRPFKLEKRGRP
jgi:type IV pilus assembly protein PilQ